MIILFRAGLGLDPGAIKKLSFVCFRLAFVPCLVESGTMALCAHLLFGLPLSWALMLGFVISAVSPAVVVPCLLRLQQLKYGIAKGVPTLVIAASSIDDVLAITGFSVCLSMAFTNVNQQNGSEAWNLAKSILKGPFEAVVGIAFGSFAGWLLWYLPEKCKQEDQNQATSRYDLHRFVFLFLAGVLALFGSQSLNLSGSGPLAVLVLAFVASLKWRQVGFDTYNEDCLSVLWEIFQHPLFCLIGTDVRIKNMQPEMILYGLVCLLVSVAVRTVVAYLVSYGAGYTRKEKLFIAIAWLPKATVQAAIGPVALDLATNESETANGRLILTIAVLSIMVTAPIGAIAVDYFGKVLLDKNEDPEPRFEIVLSHHKEEGTELDCLDKIDGKSA